MFGKSDSITTTHMLNSPGRGNVLHTSGTRKLLLLVRGVIGLAALVSLVAGTFLFTASAQVSAASTEAPSVACSTLSFAPPTNLPVGANPWAVAVGDFNRDGNPDVAAVNNGSNSVTVQWNNS